MARGKRKTIAEKIPVEHKFFSPLFVYLGVTTVGLIIFLLYFFLIVKDPHHAIKPVNIFFTFVDRHMDFFNLVFTTQKLNTYSYIPSASSPVFYIICFFINKMIPEIHANQFVIRDILLGKVVYGVYIGISLVLFLAAFNMLFDKFRTKALIRIWFFVIFLSSFPVLFAIDRGNYALMTGGLIALFLIAYTDGRTILAAVILAFAVTLKYYYALFFIIFLTDKKYMAFVISTMTAAAIFYFSLASFENGFIFNAGNLLKNLSAYNTGWSMRVIEELSHNTSVYMLFDIPHAISNNLFDKTGDALLEYHQKISIVAGLILFLTVVLAFCVKRKHDKFLLFTVGALLFPFLSRDYIIPVIFMPVLFWLLSEPEDKVMPWLTALYIICKRYFSFYDRGGEMSLTIQEFINPVLLLMIICYIAWLRREEIKEAVCRITKLLEFKKRKIRDYV